MEAKYKVGQELQTNEGDRHVVEEVRYRYVVRRTHAEPVKGVRLTVGAINEYREEDLTPYVRPIAVGDHVSTPFGIGTVDSIRKGWACVFIVNGWSSCQLSNCKRLPEESA